MAVSEEGEGEGDATYIWGTNLSVARIQSRFNVFVREFREEGQAEPKYLRLLQEVRRAASGPLGGMRHRRGRVPLLLLLLPGTEGPSPVWECCAESNPLVLVSVVLRPVAKQAALLRGPKP